MGAGLIEIPTIRTGDVTGQAIHSMVGSSYQALLDKLTGGDGLADSGDTTKVYRSAINNGVVSLQCQKLVAINDESTPYIVVLGFDDFSHCAAYWMIPRGK